MREHDVILAMNNQPVEGEAQLRRMLRDTPPGRAVTFLISRDGQQQSVSVQLADRAKLDFHPDPVPQPDDSAELSGSGPSLGSNFISGLGINPLYTGLELDMLGPQLAVYFGVQDGSGLLVKRVDDNSPGAAAGLRAGDVITRVNGKPVATTGQWVHTLHANRGKQLQLTVVRDHKENTLNMTAGHAKEKGELDRPDTAARLRGLS
jgi:S1-C subfamily serine protease